ncbi:hypothetical protein AB0D10_16240 [Kitasatospora sp. NPDC048545]|uniref:hypothetical protein n=1 Tax=Kitasatospora sp. NPDC048545 TaxID=3157208 RepID=UPI0033EFCD65
MLMDLGLVDVEWADADGGGLRRSVLEEVARVAFESASPVRRFASYRGQRRFPGWYWTATTASLVGFESYRIPQKPDALRISSRVFSLDLATPQLGARSTDKLNATGHALPTTG